MYKKENPISLKFVAGIIAILCIIFYYISIPSDKQNLKKKPSFEQQLEQRKDYSKRNKVQTEQTQTEIAYSNTIIQPSQELVPPNTIPVTNNTQTSNTQKIEYTQLLDKLKDFPTKNQQQVQAVVNEFLKYKGYPENLVKAVAKDIDQSKAKTHENYMVANFDFSSGNLNISPLMLFKLGNKELIAILAHELDHFDKLANTCKSMGISEYEALFNENDITIDRGFWAQAASLAKDSSFDAKLYQDALKRFITQNDLELTSSYSDFYKLSENLRNPLEVNAYKESDKVYDYYGIKHEDGPIKKLVTKFNDVDWAVYHFIEKDPLLANQRIVIFDYYFIQAILSKMPEFQKDFDKCIQNRNGDLTSFWVAYENSVSSFYHRGAMDKNTYDKIYSLMEETENKAKKPLSSQDILKAFAYKINTLFANLVYPNAVKNLRSINVDYLTYLKKNGLKDDNQELKSIITLICIDNELYKSNADKDISLYYLNIPKEIETMYDVKSNKNKFMFIYQLPAFINQRSVAISEQNALIDMINANRLDIRIKD
ncbi:hypothetical protein IJ182_03090 [bacterium]|nr:hypothetical protein [bacterium]